ncbi:hypothetical protein FNU79_07780 [Deinococcus detaillensis]|uniref:Uncharacterized protein n=1 Tax=Deinococcus detaillensis TaxID=2592048 RepID=A0A553V0U8_9DEIO|nr:DUF6683 family protein [Deinococcus detaillensis]TSA86082.1 hypothetical protein FNU79_07780 [Deinococcus detaillensis]
MGNVRHGKRNRWQVMLAAGALLSSGQAQFFTPSFQNYQSFAQRSVGYVAATVRPDFTAKVVQQALKPPATPVKYKYELSKTDFAFKGAPTQQKNCAAMVQKASDQKQMADACLQLFNAAQSIPEFRKNNLASGLTLLIGISLQVQTSVELGETETEALQRGLNDLLVDSGVMKGKQSDLQAMYETSVMTGALIAAIAQSGADDASAELTTTAKALAAIVLKGMKL